MFVVKRFAVLLVAMVTKTLSDSVLGTNNNYTDVHQFNIDNNLLGTTSQISA